MATSDSTTTEVAAGPNAAAWLSVVGVGVVAATHIWKLPSALQQLQAELHFDLLFSGVLLGVIQVASMLGGLLAAWCGERYGLRRLLMLGLLLLGVGSLLGAASPDALVLLCSRLLEGIGFVLCTVLAPALIRLNCAPTELNRAMGAWGSFQGLATLAGLSLSSLMLEWTSWRWLWVAMALLSLAMLLPLARLVPDDRRARHTESGVRGQIVATARQPAPWLTGLGFACYTVQWMAVMGFLPAIYGAFGISALTAGLFSAGVGGVNIIGAVVAGRMLQSGRSPSALLVFAFLIMAVSSIGFFALPWALIGGGLVGALACAAVFSLVGGMAPAVFSRIGVDLASDGGSVSAVIGLMQQLFNVGNFIGPFILAWVAVLAGGWQASWVMTCTFSAMGIWLVLLLRRRLTSGSRVESQGQASGAGAR